MTVGLTTAESVMKAAENECDSWDGQEREALGCPPCWRCHRDAVSSFRHFEGAPGAAQVAAMLTALRSVSHLPIAVQLLQ